MMRVISPKSALFFLIALCGIGFSFSSFAVKTVPTIRIEIPKKTEPRNEAEQENLSPSIPLEEDDLFPSVDDTPPILEEDSAEPDEPGLIEHDTIEEADEETEPRAPVKVFYGDDGLPEAVKTTRKKLLDAAHSGDVEKLRPIFEAFGEVPTLTFDEADDPIEFLKTSSGDGEGREMLAILIEVLEAGYIRRDEGEDGDIYIWPYFVDIAPEDLKADQVVELFQLITAGDFEDMQAYGAYIFYRAGITPNGELKFFVAGD